MSTLRSHGGNGGESVLLVSTNRERQPYPVVPNGVGCVASALAAAGHEVHVADLCFDRDPVEAARRAARTARPRFIGVSVRNIDNSDAIALRNYTPEAETVLAALRAEAPGARVIAGGAAFGVAPEALFDRLCVDYAIAGDGERATVALIDSLRRGSDALPAGVVRRDGDRIVFSPPGDDADLDSLPRAELQRWFELGRYQRHGATIPIQTKRGCVFRCVYCTYRNVEGFGYRTRDPRDVADEIDALRRSAGVSHFDFVDSTFNSPPGHAIEVCEEIARLGSGVKLETMNFTPASVSEELVTAMRAAGFVAVGITAESASDDVLHRLEKGFTLSKVHDAADRIDRAGIRTLWIFLVGGPGETPRTVRETLRFAARRLRRGDAVYVTVGLRVYPGTTLHRIAVEEGVVERGDPLLDPTFYFSRELDFERTVSELRTFAAAHPRFMFSADSRSRLLPYLMRTASLLHLPRPHWRYMGVFQRISRAVA